MEQQVVFFDDICVLCSRSVGFIYRHDPRGRFRFASFDSEAFREIAGLLPETMEVGNSEGSQASPGAMNSGGKGRSQVSPGEMNAGGKDSSQVSPGDMNAGGKDSSQASNGAMRAGGKDSSQASNSAMRAGGKDRSQASPGEMEVRSSSGSQAPSGSVVLYRRGKVYLRSTAALRIAMSLRFPMPLMAAGFLLPPFIRNGIYDWIARNRYRWFGKRESCFMPDGELRERFLE